MPAPDDDLDWLSRSPTVKDLTPMLRRIEEEERNDPRPWYVKGYPFFEPNQMVKIVQAIPRSNFEGQTGRLSELALGWMRRLTLGEKRLLIEETTRDTDPALYEAEKANLTLAKFLFCKDETGARVEPMSEKTGNREFTVIFVEMLTDNWKEVSSREFEHTVVHELLHVLNPTQGLVLGYDGRLHEDEKEMHERTEKIISMYGSLVKGNPTS